MVKSKGIKLGLLAVAVFGLLALAFVALNPPLAVASPGTAPTPTSAAPTGGTPNPYTALFVKNFAARLGVDQDKLNAAFRGAVNDTLAQAVKDGKMSQSDADAMSIKIGQAGLQGFMNVGVQGIGQQKTIDPRMEQFSQKLQNELLPNAFAGALHMSKTDLATQAKAGKTVSELAQAQHLDLGQVKQAALASLKSSLDQLVKSGGLQQNEADGVYEKLSRGMDTLVNDPAFLAGR